MTDDNPSMISHVSVGTNNFEQAKAFYTTVLATLGCRIIMEHPGAVAFGKAYPEFWVGTPYDQKEASVGNGGHVGFAAASRDQVDAFYKAALKAGATEDGDPGHRHEYGEPYYGCFVRDLDGHKIEATYWDMELAKKLGMG
jgi:catechol 2,3-dioxygenase-like lactoylglutathione lyase family enzyme